MADEAIPTAPAPEAAPAPETPPPAAPAEAAAAPEAPSVAPAPDAGAAAPHDEPTLLEKHDAEAKATEPTSEPVAEKPAETEKKPEAAPDPTAEKPAEAKPADKPAEPEAKPAEPAPVELKFDLPEALKNTKADDPILTEFKTVIGSGKTPQEIGQGLLDLHAKAMQSYADQVRDDQYKVFNETRKDWQNEVKSDPEIGGAGHQTAMKAIARARDFFVSSARPGSEKYAADMKAFNTFLHVTGAGDHPAFLKFLHNIARFADEPTLPPDNAKPPPDNGKERRGAKVLYDNPRSNLNRQ